MNGWQKVVLVVALLASVVILTLTGHDGAAGTLLILGAIGLILGWLDS